MTRPQATFNMLLQLPHEIVAAVASHLDCVSVAALLSAFEELHEMALIITDTDAPLRFFRIPGVERRVCTYEELKEGVKGSHGAALIKLIEFTKAGVKGLQRETYTSQLGNLGRNKPLDFLGSDTFLFLHMDCVRINVESQRMKVFLDNVCAHYYFDENPYGGLHLWQSADESTISGPRVLSHDHFGISNGFSLSCSFLKELRLTNVTEVRDVFLFALEELVITFGDLQTGATPTLYNFTSPSLKKLAITFDRRVPIFANVSTDSLLSFELHDLRALAKFHIPYEPDYISITNIITSLIDLTFTSTCKYIALSGLPDDIIPCVDFTACENFNWRRFCKLSTQGCIETISATALHLLTIYNVVPNTILPTFETAENQLGIRFLSIVSLAPGLNFRKMLDSPFFHFTLDVLINIDIHPSFDEFNVPRIPIDILYTHCGEWLERLYVYGCCLQKRSPTPYEFSSLKRVELHVEMWPNRKTGQGDRWYVGFSAPRMTDFWFTQKRFSGVGVKPDYAASWCRLHSISVKSLKRFRSGPFSYGMIFIPETEQVLEGDGSQDGHLIWKYNRHTGIFEEMRR